MSRHLQEGGVLKLSAVLKLGTMSFTPGSDHALSDPTKTSDDAKDFYSVLGPFSNLLGNHLYVFICLFVAQL